MTHKKKKLARQKESQGNRSGVRVGVDAFPSHLIPPPSLSLDLVMTKNSFRKMSDSSCSVGLRTRTLRVSPSKKTKGGKEGVNTTARQRRGEGGWEGGGGARQEREREREQKELHRTRKGRHVQRASCAHRLVTEHKTNHLVCYLPPLPARIPRPPNSHPGPAPLRCWVCLLHAKHAMPQYFYPRDGLRKR